MLEALEHLKTLTALPISVQPNAGVPQNVGGRYIYMTSPEYIAEYAKRFIQTGASIVGGCCGTNPSHIRAIRRAVQALQPAQRMDVSVGDLGAAGARVGEGLRPDREVAPGDQAGARRVRDAGRTGVAARRLAGEGDRASARRLHHFGIDAINIPDGPRASARMSALAMAVLIQREVGIETVLHFACRDRNVIGMQSDLLGAWALGLRNILGITGDPPKLGNYPHATAVFDVDAIGLVNLINRLNHGLDLAGNADRRADRVQHRRRREPGRDQPRRGAAAARLEDRGGRRVHRSRSRCSTSASSRRFMKRIEHVKIPLLCGIWPLTSYRNAEFMNNEVPGASVPADILERMRKTTHARRRPGGGREDRRTRRSSACAARWPASSWPRRWAASTAS